jgi:hypothetical protein
VSGWFEVRSALALVSSDKKRLVRNVEVVNELLKSGTLVPAAKFGMPGWTTRLVVVTV